MGSPLAKPDWVSDVEQDRQFRDELSALDPTPLEEASHDAKYRAVSPEYSPLDSHDYVASSVGLRLSEGFRMLGSVD